MYSDRKSSVVACKPNSACTLDHWRSHGENMKVNVYWTKSGFTDDGFGPENIVGWCTSHGLELKKKNKSG